MLSPCSCATAPRSTTLASSRRRSPAPSAPTRWRPSAARARAAAAAVLRSSDCSRRSASRSSRRPDPRPPRSKRRTDVQGQAEIIELLNEVLTAELTAINQYFVHAKMQDNWGYGRLASTTRDESIDEMKHAEKVVERILYLDGTPNLQRLSPLRVGETPHEHLRLDLELERAEIGRASRRESVCQNV